MRLMTRAGTPPTIVLAGTSLVTTAPAATTALSPIVTPCRMVAFEPTHTFLPNTIGAGRVTPLLSAGSSWLSVANTTLCPSGVQTEGDSTGFFAHLMHKPMDLIRIKRLSCLYVSFEFCYCHRIYYILCFQRCKNTIPNSSLPYPDYGNNYHFCGLEHKMGSYDLGFAYSQMSLCHYGL